MLKPHTRYPGLDGDEPVPALVGAPQPRTIDPAQRGWDDAVAGKSALQAPAAIRQNPEAYTVYLWAHFEAYGAMGRQTPYDAVQANPVGVRSEKVA